MDLLSSQPQGVAVACPLNKRVLQEKGHHAVSQSCAATEEARLGLTITRADRAGAFSVQAYLSGGLASIRVWYSPKNLHQGFPASSEVCD